VEEYGYGGCNKKLDKGKGKALEPVTDNRLKKNRAKN